MVFRERKEKTAMLDAVFDVVGRMFNIDTDKVFSYTRQKYEIEVFQETYDSNLLRAKVSAMRDIIDSMRRKRREEASMMDKLSKMGEMYETGDNKKKPPGRK
jgi:hypothetical protein